MEKPNVEGFRLKFAAARSIARLLGVKPSDRPRKVLSEVSTNIAVYRHVAEFDRCSPSAAEVRDRIVKLGHDVQALLAELEVLQPYMEGLPGKARPRRTPFVPTKSFKKHLAELASIALSAQHASLSPGRPRDRALVFLVRELGDIYRRCTSKKPAVTWRADRGEFAGKFFELVECCVEAAGLPDKKSNETLGTAIKRALKS